MTWWLEAVASERNLGAESRELGTRRCELKTTSCKPQADPQTEGWAVTLARSQGWKKSSPLSKGGEKVAKGGKRAC